jgi:uncharacterized lipoprotein YajG
MSRNDRRALCASVFLCVLMALVFLTGCVRPPERTSPNATPWGWAPQEKWKI